jgi:hypothetical protein
MGWSKKDCGRTSGPRGETGQQAENEGEREKGRIPFSFSEMTFPNTFSNDFLSFLAFE